MPPRIQRRLRDRSRGQSREPPQTLGIWAVTGNHDSFLRREGSESLLEGAGISYLRNSWREVRPGLVLSGIDDSRHRRNERYSMPLYRYLGAADEAVETRRDYPREPEGKGKT